MVSQNADGRRAERVGRRLPDQPKRGVPLRTGAPRSGRGAGQNRPRTAPRVRRTGVTFRRARRLIRWKRSAGRAAPAGVGRPGGPDGAPVDDSLGRSQFGRAVAGATREGGVSQAHTSGARRPGTAVGHPVAGIPTASRNPNELVAEGNLWTTRAEAVYLALDERAAATGPGGLESTCLVSRRRYLAYRARR